MISIFRAAAMASSGGRRRRWRRPKRLIVITLGDVAQRRDLDPDLRILLKSATVLQWSDKRFWEKLKYAMPETAPQGREIQIHKSATRASSMNGTLMTSSGFSPDDSFRYETYHRGGGGNQNHPHTLNLNHHHHHNHPYHHHNGYASRTMQQPGHNLATAGHNWQQQQQQQLHQQQPIYHAPSSTNRSLGSGGSSVYQSISTPDEQDSSTRTMTIHI